MGLLLVEPAFFIDGKFNWLLNRPSAKIKAILEG